MTTTVLPLAHIPSFPAYFRPSRSSRTGIPHLPQQNLRIRFYSISSNGIPCRMDVRHFQANVQHMDYITTEINDVDKMIENMNSSNTDFENAVQFLCTIPDVKRDSAVTVISKIGTDMFQFSSSKRLCYRAGLTSRSNESLSKPFHRKQSMQYLMLLEIPVIPFIVSVMNNVSFCGTIPMRFIC